MRMGFGFGMDAGMQASAGADLDFNYPMLGLPYALQRLGFTYTRNSGVAFGLGAAMAAMPASPAPAAPRSARPRSTIPPITMPAPI